VLEKNEIDTRRERAIGESQSIRIRRMVGALLESNRSKLLLTFVRYMKTDLSNDERKVVEVLRRGKEITVNLKDAYKWN